MVEEHWIQWIYLETKEGVQRKCLNPGDEPKAVFALNDGDKAVAAYEYCNLHGLWKKEA
jgi:superoxide reductase